MRVPGRWAPQLTAGAVSLAFALPLLAPGFVLAYDMVFVPAQPLSRALLGLSRTLPRAVPAEFLVALASRAVSGQVVQKVILLGIPALATWGAARLVPSRRPEARVGAGLLYAWNPFVFERFLLGQWALLLGYALLPWVVRAALDAGRGEPGARGRLLFWLAAAAAAGPYAGPVALTVATVILATTGDGGSGRKAPGVVRMALAGLTLNLPWVVPGVLSHAPPPTAAQLSLFAARADSSLGTVGSLLSLGGVWRTDLAPPGRATWGWVGAFLLIAFLTVVGWRELRRRWPPGAVVGLAVAAGAGLLLAAAPRLPGTREAILWVARALPGGAILRDSQRFAVPLALAEAVGFGLGVEWLLVRLGREARWARVAGLAVPLLPIALAPTLAWGAGWRLSPVPYPASWAAAERIMSADPAPGAVLVLPWHAYLPFAWNGNRTVHQPAIEYFSRPVVASSALEVGGATLPEEDPWARSARPLVESARPLAGDVAGLGVRYVLLFREADWRRWRGSTAGLVSVLDPGDLALYRAPPPVRLPAFPHPSPVAVLGGDVAALTVLAWAVVAAVRKRRRRRNPPGGAISTDHPQHAFAGKQERVL